MKYIKEEISGADKTRFLIALGKEEAELMLAIVTRAYMFTPRTQDDQSMVQRIRNFKKVFSELVKSFNPPNEI